MLPKSLREKMRNGAQDIVVSASGSSMRPLIRTGDRFRIDPCPPRKLKPGDLELHEEGDRLILHRFHQLVDEGGGSKFFLRTKGDSRAGFDAPVKPTAYLGRAVPLIDSKVSFLFWFIINQWQILIHVRSRQCLRLLRKLRRAPR